MEPEVILKNGLIGIVIILIGIVVGLMLQTGGVMISFTLILIIPAALGIAGRETVPVGISLFCVYIIGLTPVLLLTGANGYTLIGLAIVFLTTWIGSLQFLSKIVEEDSR